VVIKVILPGSPLEKAQIPIGAILTRIDDKSIQTRDSYVAAIRAHEPGDEITLKFRTTSNETEQEVSFRLGSLQ
jgi:putative serine protease PepD